MSLYRAATETLHEIRTRVRQECEDQAEDPAGNAIPAEGNEFADYEYNRSINDALKFLALRSFIDLPGEALVVSAFDYSEGTDGQGVAIPVAATGNPILILEVLDSDVPREIYYCTPQEIEHYTLNRENTGSRVTDRLYYTLISDNTAPETQRLKIRPTPGGVSLRLWSIAAPIITSDDGDLPILTARWADLIALDAALRLLRRSGRGTPAQSAAWTGWLALFDQMASRRGDMDRVRLPRGRM